MSLNVEELRRKATSFRNRADATSDVREQDACLALARDYEAYLASLRPGPAAQAAEAEGARSASGTAGPDAGDRQGGLRQKARD